MSVDKRTGILFVIDIKYTKKEYNAVTVIEEEEGRNYKLS
jgi:hypothetical protein